MSFSFDFSGDDIENERDENFVQTDAISVASGASLPHQHAFPIPGKPQLPATQHHISDLLASLPSRISYSLLHISLDETSAHGASVDLPRRELWDVRVQIMAEDEHVMTSSEDHVDNGGLGRHDVKTGIYEGGFKSWESSVDLVKVLAAQKHLFPSTDNDSGLRIVELGCGTGLPSLALFQWILNQTTRSQSHKRSCSLVLADYNPSVLRLVTLPNFLLAWALHHRESPALQDALSMEGELELSPSLLASFQHFLSEHRIDLSFISGAWSSQFLELLYRLPPFVEAELPTATRLLGAETIYSPFALEAFTEVLFSILEREKAALGASASAYVAAKRLYFGVGGSLTDFVDGARQRGATVTELSEETEGVRRGVVQCHLP